MTTAPAAYTGKGLAPAYLRCEYLVNPLGIGEPGFVTPWHIREAGIYALERGRTNYTSNYGLIKLRQHVVAGQNQFLMLKRCEEGHVILIIEDDDRQCGAQEFQGTGPSFGVELLATDP
jgi:hypothetical protein